MKKPILIDLDGVLRIKGKPAKGLNEFLSFLTEAEIPSCILSNSTLSTSKQIKEFFQNNSVDLSLPLITAVDAARDYVSKKYSRVAVYMSDAVISEFTNILDYDNPEAVLIGDISDKWNYQLMQTIFQYIRNGAELIAAHKNKYWEKPGSGIILDAGPFIQGLEYASSQNATLIGKPSPLYFQSALDKIGFGIGTSFYMLGDDIDSDIKGGKVNNAKTILIYTGKTKEFPGNEYLDLIDFEAESLMDVINLLKKELN